MQRQIQMGGKETMLTQLELVKIVQEKHPEGRALLSEWSTKSLIMIVYENFFFKFSQNFFVQSMTKFFLSHKTIIRLFMDQSEVSTLPAEWKRRPLANKVSWPPYSFWIRCRMLSVGVHLLVSDGFRGGGRKDNEFAVLLPKCRLRI